MNVLLINGSPHKEGCTYTALCEIAKELNNEQIDTNIIHIGTKPIAGCIDCGKCVQTGYCVFNDDPVNKCVDIMKESDGLIIGSPVYYAGPNGALCSFLDRMFYRKTKFYEYKPAAAIVNCRRGGASASFDRLNKYFTISNMPVVSSQYWNSTHGFIPEETLQDLEGLQTMRTLGRNMAWLIKCISYSKEKYPHPSREPQIMTNFIK